MDRYGRSNNDARTHSAAILLDFTPASGASGLRGIGRYVRGLLAALEHDDVLRTLVVGLTEPMTTGSGLARYVPSPLPRAVVEWRWQDLAWATGWVSDSIAFALSGATAFHHTDPRKPLRPSGVQRLVVTAYDLTPLEQVIWGRLRQHRRAIYGLYLRLIRDAERVIAISAATADALAERLDIDRGRIDVVPPVVPSSHTRWEGAGSEITFLSVGAPDWHKNPELAIAAIAVFRREYGEGRLRIIGPVADKRRSELLQLAARHGVAENIAIEGYVSEAELEDAYRSATAALSVSLLEGFGLPAVEAAVRGVPVISVDTPVAREALGTAATFVPPDAASVSHAMASPTPPGFDVRAALLERYSTTAVAEGLGGSYRRLFRGR